MRSSPPRDPRVRSSSRDPHRKRESAGALGIAAIAVSVGQQTQVPITDHTRSSNDAPTSGSAATPGSDPWKTEQDRILSRRKDSGVDCGAAVWGLALSGGGIRSATFSFGVMQGMASLDGLGAAETLTEKTTAARPLLSRFDYLSTVSGGGYIGAFFCSLFVPGRLNPVRKKPAEAADDAYATMRTVPPHRLRVSDVFDKDHPGRCPTAWLRENGRYLAPGGAGDYLYAAATGVRNWLAIHYVIALGFLVLFGLLGLVRSTTQWVCLIASQWIRQPGLQYDAVRRIPWDILWWMCALVALVWVAPSCLAYWFSYPGVNKTDKSPAPGGLNLGSTMTLVGAAALGAMCFGAVCLDTPMLLRVFLGVSAIIGGLAFLTYAAAHRREDSVSAIRVRLTRVTSAGITTILVLGIFATADALGRWLYDNSGRFALTTSSILAAAVYIIRTATHFISSNSTSSSISKVPLGVLAGIAGIALVLGVGSIWSMTVLMLTLPPPPFFLQLTAAPYLAACAGIVLIAALLNFVAGMFPGFVNLSTMQNYYSARLTRAYLGASNGVRFATSDPKTRSAAEPLDSDSLDLSRYYDEKSLAPIHIINVTLNETVDPGEQLVQRDRKGRPLAVLPHGFTIDGAYARFPDPSVKGVAQSARNGTGAETLGLGQWVAVSGAAVSTGLGRLTSFGTSVLCGFANVRLGMWWSSGEGRRGGALSRLLFRCFRTQTYLIYEFLGRFYGLKRPLQYLSDGGHFDNTGLYELLRPQRGLKLLVCCDNGADASYGFDDLSNLVRLARIDFALDIEVDEGITSCGRLGKVFGVPSDFKAGDAMDDRCAILLNVFRSDDPGPRRNVMARVIILKPRVIARSSMDIVNYQSGHKRFPQESTAEQFFDEAQWESYRDLGYRIALLVFGSAPGGVGDELTAYLQKPVGDM